MKMNNNGSIEGTPQEIAEYVRALQGQRPCFPQPAPLFPWWGVFPPDTVYPRIWGTGQAEWMAARPINISDSTAIANTQTEAPWDGHWRN